MRIFGQTAALALFAFALVGCEGATEPLVEGNCILGLRVDGIDYGVQDRLDDAASFNPGPQFATVTRRRECQDMLVASDGESPQVPEPFQDGDANFLDVGTRLFEVPGYAPAERLAAEVEDGWFMVIAQDPVTGLIENSVQVRLFLDAAHVTPPATLTARLQYNVTGEDQRTVSSPSACPAAVSVFQGETRIPFPATEEVCAQVVTQWVLTATDSLIREWALEIGPDATPLEPGTYRFVADLNTHEQTFELDFEVR